MVVGNSDTVASFSIVLTILWMLRLETLQKVPVTLCYPIEVTTTF